ncbi:MAG: ATP-binding cassette domain-containing protein [Bacteroidota bacterium]
MSQPPHNGDASTVGPSNGAGTASASGHRGLREQAIEAFGILQRRADRVIAPERLRSFLQSRPISSFALFELLAEFARAQGLVVVHQDIAPDELLDRGLVDDLVLLPAGDIGLVMEVNTFARSITVQNLGPGAQERHNVDELARAYPGEIQVLHLQGQAPRFLDDGTHAPPLYSDHAADIDPHDRLDNARETFESLLRLMSDERSDIVTVTMYAVMVALFSLTIPLASQGIIDAVSMGTFTNQIVIFCAAISVGLLLYGIFTMLQYYTVDVLQRRLFAATGLEIAYRIPMMKRSALEGEYGPALMNRFFDVITMQKSLAKLLIDGLSYSLVALVSLVLLAIYSPFFLVVGLLAVLFTPVLIWGLGRNALDTSFRESSTKYAMAHWLEDLSRCHQSFKLNGATSYVHARTDRLAARYVRTRGDHFRIFGRQLASAAVFRALVVGIALGIGGYLVTRGDISLGQFVAAELVIVSLTGAGFNLVKLFDQVYDLLTAISKILHITDKPLEAVGGEPMPARTGPATLELRGVTVGYGSRPALRDVSFRAEAGTHVSVVGVGGAGKSTLSRTLVRLHKPESGRITFDGHDIRRLDLKAYRRDIGMALSTDELFKGTLEDNITMGRDFTYPEMQQALHMADLEDDVLGLRDGLSTAVTSAGLEFAQGFVRRIMIARAIIGEPRVLILDEAFNGIEEPVKQKLMDRIYAHGAWTLITVTDDDPETVERADHVIVLDRGSVVWSGRPRALAHEPDAFLCEHFPQLVASLRTSQPTSA